jgi:predicted Holliday junction resolvase-like endonuclease
MVTGVIAVLVGLAIGLLVCWLILRGQMAQWAEEVFKQRRDADIGKICAKSLKQSEAALHGQISEQVAPLSPAFPYRLADVRHLGSPIDFIVFDGYSEWRAGSLETLRGIVLIDAKARGSSLVRIQRCVQAALSKPGGVSCHTLTSQQEVSDG